MKTVAALFILWLSGASAWAGTIETVIAPPAGPSPAGREMVFSMYVHNVGVEAAEAAVPERLTCHLASGDLEITAEARRIAPAGADTVSLNPGGFVKASYAVVVPRSMEGPTRMTVRGLDAACVMFAVTGTSLAESIETAPDTASHDASPLTPDALFSAYNPYLGNIEPYKPIYFLLGADPEESKFQISFKYRFFNPGGSMAKKHPLGQRVPFGLHPDLFLGFAFGFRTFQGHQLQTGIVFHVIHREVRAF